MLGNKDGTITRSLDGRTTRYALERAIDERSTRQLREKSRLETVAWIRDLARWDIYATLTFDPARSGYNPDARGVAQRPITDAGAIARYRRWVRDAESFSSRVVCSVGALERTRANWPHFHALLGMGGVSETEFVALSRLWFETSGYARFSRVDRQDAGSIAAYIGKYLTKSETDVLLLGPFAGKEGSGQLSLPTRRMPRRNL